MRIAVNGLALGPEPTGIGRTTRQTLRALLARDHENEYVVFVPADAPADCGLDAPNLALVRTDVSLAQPWRAMLFEEFELPRRLKGARIDLYYSPSYLLPAFPGAALEVVCVHDLAWRFFPRSKSLRFRTYMNARLPAALTRADRVVCVSQATADDVRREYGEKLGSRLRVVRNGVDHDVFRPADVAVAGDEEPFLAVVGNQDPRKNIPTLLEAFPTFRARMRPCRLVLAGPGPRPRAAPPAVDFLGYLEDDELVALYRRALLVVQPSLYEGFGLPILEAMACGAPVACADIPVFREVAGDCARYFDPTDVRSIADTMADLAKDDAERARLSLHGAARAREFSWDATAAALQGVLREAAA